MSARTPKSTAKPLSHSVVKDLHAQASQQPDEEQMATFLSLLLASLGSEGGEQGKDCDPDDDAPDYDAGPGFSQPDNSDNVAADGAW